MGQNAGLIFGALYGGGLAIGLFLLRRFWWKGAMGLGWLALGALLLGGLYAVAAIARPSGGSDASMYKAMFLIAVVAGTGLVAICSVLLCLIQGRAMGKPIGISLLAFLPDPLLLGAGYLFLLNGVTGPIERKTTDDWWQQELARRKRVEGYQKRIPEKYRQITSQQLNWHARVIAESKKYGHITPPLVPPDVENAIRNYENESAKPQPIPNRQVYREIGDMRNAYLAASILAWLAGVALTPLLAKIRPIKA